MKTMKYKVLAADDEFWSRENIRNLIPWEGNIPWNFWNLHVTVRRLWKG
ncbi:MAG: hypothetical protein ACLUPF_06585 [Dorea sp.]